MTLPLEKAPRLLADQAGCSEEAAREAIFKALREGDLHAYAGSRTVHRKVRPEVRVAAPLELDDWLVGKVDWLKGELARPVSQLPPNVFRAPLADGAFMRACGIELLNADDVFPIIRERLRASLSKDVSKKNVGGTPGKYDWAAAAAAFWTIENGFPKPNNKQPLVSYMLDWFSERGHNPDKREVERWVKIILEEKERLASRSR